MCIFLAYISPILEYSTIAPSFGLHIMYISDIDTLESVQRRLSLYPVADQVKPSFVIFDIRTL